MRVIKRKSYICLPLFLTSCIERYYPESDDIFTGTLVINAALTNIPGTQAIQISRSDGLIYPEFIPETGCVVELENQAGEQLSFTEGSPGYYSVNMPDSLDDRQCWITGHVNEIYTLDAANLSSPAYTYMPLHFVSNETQRLSYGYGLYVRQHAMDEPSFRYWDDLKLNSHTQSGLYDRLPSMTLKWEEVTQVRQFFNVSIAGCVMGARATHQIFGQ